MQFRTKISIPKSDNSIDYNSKIVSLGSCFAVNMNEKFQYFKFQITTNPFGIIFNPVSIATFIQKVINQELFTEKDIFFHNERWHCFDVHSDLSNSNKEYLLNNLNELLQSTKQQFQEATHIIITYGTSWVYRNTVTNQIVANCHKVPQKQFVKEILSVETIEKSMQNTLALIQKINPNVHFIFTVSPVRHLKDGFVENQLSKAHLITAIHQILKSAPEPKGRTGEAICNLKSAIYFPSYEIMMDELRDYRFYAEDMIHPNPVAINYIWEQFFQTQINSAIYPVMDEVCSIQKGLQHRPFNPNSDQHKKFLDSLNQKIAFLKGKIPHLQF